MNTKIEYLYRDACNYKAWQEVILAGEITEEDKQKITDSLECVTDFIPEQVGLQVFRPWGKITEDDTCYCELEPDTAFTLTDEAPTDDRTIHELAQDFADQKGWDAITYAVFPDPDDEDEEE